MDRLRQVTHIDNVKLGEDRASVVIIDQTKLPSKTEYLTLRTAKDLYDAIFELKVRGAPAIGICAGFGIYVLARTIDTESYDDFYAQFRKYRQYLDSARPTAVNLSWALNRMEQVVTAHKESSVEDILKLLEEECLAKGWGRYPDSLQCRTSCHIPLWHGFGPAFSGEGTGHGV